MSEDQQVNSEFEDARLSSGQLLKQERERQGISVTEVAEKLHLSEQLISQLEVDDYSSAASLIYVRGYIRAYSRLLKLDPETVLAGFADSHWQGRRDTDSVTLAASKPVLSARQPDLIQNLPKRRRINKRAWLFALIIAVIVVLIFWSLHHYHKTSLVQPSAARSRALPSLTVKPVANANQDGQSQTVALSAKTLAKIRAAAAKDQMHKNAVYHRGE